MDIYQLNARQTTIIAIMVLYLGKFLTRKITFLKNYNIPDAVSGGVIASLFFGFCYFVFRFQIEFNLALRDYLLIIFFTTIGLSSKLKTLLQGGKPLLILLILSIVFIFFQNLTGVGLAFLTGQPLPIGVLAGSVSLSGGHGTAIAWSPILRDTYGVANASEIGIACATFGLIIGGIVGGPLAKWLILKNKLEPRSNGGELSVGIGRERKNVKIDYNTMLDSILIIAIAIGLGGYFNEAIDALGVKLPDFVTCLLAGILFTNAAPLIIKRFPRLDGTPSLALISDVCLGLFLAMSLMSLQLWTLLGLAGPILLILVAQFALSVIYTIFVVFALMGRCYDAAVICAGSFGLTLGATPTAIANMTAVTEQFGPSPKAFIIVPLIGAFFIDIANAIVIQKFLTFFG